MNAACRGRTGIYKKAALNETRRTLPLTYTTIYIFTGELKKVKESKVLRGKRFVCYLKAFVMP